MNFCLLVTDGFNGDCRRGLFLELRSSIRINLNAECLKVKESHIEKRFVCDLKRAPLRPWLASNNWWIILVEQYLRRLIHNLQHKWLWHKCLFTCSLFCQLSNNLLPFWQFAISCKAGDYMMSLLAVQYVDFNDTNYPQAEQSPEDAVRKSI